MNRTTRSKRCNPLQLHTVERVLRPTVIIITHVTLDCLSLYHVAMDTMMWIWTWILDVVMYRGTDVDEDIGIDIDSRHTIDIDMAMANTHT